MNNLDADIPPLYWNKTSLTKTRFLERCLAWIVSIYYVYQIPTQAHTAVHTCLVVMQELLNRNKDRHYGNNMFDIMLQGSTDGRKLSSLLSPIYIFIVMT